MVVVLVVVVVSVVVGVLYTVQGKYRYSSQLWSAATVLLLSRACQFVPMLYEFIPINAEFFGSHHIGMKYEFIPHMNWYYFKVSHTTQNTVHTNYKYLTNDSSLRHHCHYVIIVPGLCKKESLYFIMVTLQKLQVFLFVIGKVFHAGEASAASSRCWI